MKRKIVQTKDGSRIYRCSKGNKWGKKVFLTKNHEGIVETNRKQGETPVMINDRNNEEKEYLGNKFMERNLYGIDLNMKPSHLYFG